MLAAGQGMMSMKVVGIEILEDGRSMLIVDCGPEELIYGNECATGLLDERLGNSAYLEPFSMQGKS